MQATWHALQPMHFVVSISLATVPVAGSRTPGEGVVVAERRTMSRDCIAMWESSGLLYPDEERLELGRLHVAVADERGQRVRQVAGFRHAGESPVDRNAYGVHLLAVDVELPDALGHD